MEFMKSTGESSSKGREDGDAATGSERPLKKARFAWQVKGKYHLKNETTESNKNLTRQSAETSARETSSMSQGSNSTPEYKVENYLLQQECSKLHSVRNPDNYLFTPINNIRTEQLQYPRYITSPSYNNMSSNNCKNVKTVSMSKLAEDRCIAQWQQKQIVNSFLDNTLNQVLESWTSQALPAEAVTSRFLTRDFAEFINHMPEDNSIENEGILMAISAHGLQNTSSSSSNNTSNADSCSVSSTQLYNPPSQLRSLSPMVSDDDSQNIQEQQCETAIKMPGEVQDWQSDNQNANDATSFAYFSEPSQLPYHFYHDNHESSNPDILEMDSHFDFMNSAVLYAIKSKGLTASGTEYG